MTRIPKCLLAALLCLAAAASAFAAAPWQGGKSTKLNGSGTAAEPYLISTPEDLRYLQQTPSLVTGGYHFMQTADIDLNGEHFDWDPIGYGSTNAIATTSNAFRGTYDGNGYRILNMTVNSLGHSATNASFGLFGFVYASELKNITLVNARIVRRQKGSNNAQEEKSHLDIKMGLLAGAVAPLKAAAPNSDDTKHVTSIRNIIILDSEITDNGHIVRPQSAFVGGLIGDISCGYGGYTMSIPSMNYALIDIENIYVQANIDLGAMQRNPAITSGSQYSQFNVGGIVGRLRHVPYSYLPVNVCYTGDISAKYASVGPIFGLARAIPSEGDTQYKQVWNMTASYAGTFTAVNATAANSILYLNGQWVDDEYVDNCNYNGTEIHPDQYRYFYNYRVYDHTNAAGGGYVEFDGTHKTIADGYFRSTNTLRPNVMTKTTDSSANTDQWDKEDPEDWARFQGFNRGTYEPDLSVIVARFNQVADPANIPGLTPWRIIDGKPALEQNAAFRIDQTNDYGVYVSTLTMPDESLGPFTLTWSAVLRQDGSTVQFPPISLTAPYESTLNLETATDGLLSSSGMEAPRIPAGYDRLSGTVTDRNGDPYLAYTYSFGVTEVTPTTYSEFGKFIFNATLGVTVPPSAPQYKVRIYGIPNALTDPDRLPVELQAASDVTASGPIAFSTDFPYHFESVWAELSSPNGYIASTAKIDVPKATITLGHTSYNEVQVTPNFTKSPSGGLNYKIKLYGTPVEEGSAETLLLSVDANGVTKKTLTVPDPGEKAYSELRIELVDLDGGIMASSPLVIMPFDGVLERTTYDTYRFTLNNRQTGTKAVLQFWAVPYDTAEEPVLWHTSEVNELKSPYSAQMTTLTPDVYSHVRVVICNPDGSYMGSNPDIWANTFCYFEHDNKPVGLIVSRPQANRFTATPQAPFATDTYTFHWTATPIGGGPQVDIAGNSASIIVNNYDDYESITATLCDADGNPIINAALEPVHDAITLIDDKHYYTLTIDKQLSAPDGAADPSAYKATFAYVATAKNLIGATYAGSGSIDWTGSAPDDRRAAGISGCVDMPSADDCFWLWEVNSDPTNRTGWSPTDISIIEGKTMEQLRQIPNWIVPSSTESFYRVTLCQAVRDTDGNLIYNPATGRPLYESLRTSVYGPYNIIYVYDKQKTERGRAMKITYNGVPYDITTFDGIDKSVFDTNGQLKLDSNGNPYDPEYADGSDANSGFAPYSAVRTLKRAYELCDPNRPANENIVVIMGFYYEGFNAINPNDIPYFEHGKEHLFAKPATITGQLGSIITGGAINMVNVDGNDGKPISMGAPTIFRDITFVGLKSPDHWTGTASTTATDLSTYANLYLYANLHDLTIGDNVKILGYNQINTNPNGKSLTYGLIDYSAAPHIHLIAGIHNWNKTDDLPDRPNNATPNVTRIDINSGSFARVIAGARNSGVLAKSHNIFGSAARPHRVEVNVAIAHHPSDEYPEGNPNEYTPGRNYSYDIGLLTGGQTDGSVWSETNINIREGNVGRYISGNISYGRAIEDAATGKRYPSDSYFGSSILNFTGGTITDLYGGSLGRCGDNPTVESIDCYFYGQSIITIDGGIVAGDIYGAGSGGVSGIGTCTFEGNGFNSHHTNDACIPYYLIDPATKQYVLDAKGRRVVDYADFNTIYQASVDAFGEDRAMENAAGIPMLDGTYLQFLCSRSAVNILSGTVHGDIFGGGYGYSSQIPYSMALAQAGNLFGDAYINMSAPRAVPPTVMGNIYGGGNGVANYYNDYYMALIGEGREHAEADSLARAKFGSLARIFGETYVDLSGGTVLGDVFGGSMGDPIFEDMATIYGNTHITLDGATVMGNIFGGCEFACIDHIYHKSNNDYSGSTNVYIRSGIVGNNIFGGSKGREGDDYTHTFIEGNTNVEITGGDFYPSPWLTDRNGRLVDAEDRRVDDDGFIIDTRGLPVIGEDGQPERVKKVPRTFNIYGGGYINCNVQGTANVYADRSLMRWSESFIPPEENPNALDTDTVSIFQSAYMDITYRRFCVYGGGWGENTRVLNSNVHITIPPDRPGVTKPHGYTLDKFLVNQSFFDIAGGGYSGDVGYWAKIEQRTDPETGAVVNDTIPIYTLPRSERVPDNYHVYVGGECNVLIDGYTYARKIIGGGFYGSCRVARTDVLCGSLRQVYGGSLLGYVHDRAYLNFGNRMEQFLRNDGTDTAADSIAARQKAWELNRFIYITENIYGGNDVKGIVGTTFWTNGAGKRGTEPRDGGPLFCTDVDPSETKGIIFNIYGGTFMGNVYGAGNGHYRGYYVPEWVRYDDGPARMYREVKSSVDPTKKAKIYRSRPMVGSVNINIRGNGPLIDADGNAQNDSISIHGSFFGGGRECTIGQWNTILPLEDPRRLTTGGFLHINFGGYTDIQGNMYMGNQGLVFGKQITLPEGIDLDTFDGSTTKELARLGDAAYDHWFFNNATNRYEPGYPLPGQVDGNFGMYGGHLFRGHMKEIEMAGDVELTFYRDLYADRDSTQRKRWVSYEEALTQYDAQGITLNSFFLGGLCGSMSNNRVMLYDYTTHEGFNPTDEEMAARAGHDLEKWGSIYRVVLPKGVTVRDVVSMGSESAVSKYYRFTDDFTGIIDHDDEGNPVEPERIFYGGIVTQTTHTFDKMVYNDMMRRRDPDFGYNIDLPADFYTNDAYSDMRDIPEYTLLDGTTIARLNFDDGNPALINGIDPDSPISDNRYSLALDVATGRSYAGMRETRRASDDRQTVVKLSCSATFAPKNLSTGRDSHHDTEYNYTGAVIYGGCYNSGLTIGDVVLNIGSNMLGQEIAQADYAEWYGSISGLDKYVARVYGGGYGEEATLQGDTYVNLLKDFRGMQVFGGGMLGPVTGSANVTYIGSEQSAVLGNIYGGGMRGRVGTDGQTIVGTNVTLVSGNVDNVYGGSCVGDIYGSTLVSLTDRVFDAGSDIDDENASFLTHIDYDRILQIEENYEDWSGARLIAGSVYGGNDISGNIYPPSEQTDTTADKQWHRYATTVHVYERPKVPLHTGRAAEPQMTPEEEPNEAVNPGKDTPGAANGYNGFPLIGELYGGSNGNYGTQNEENSHYASGMIRLANGHGAGTYDIDLEKVRVPVPHIPTTRIILNGGSIINAYGGGNRASVTDSATLIVNYDSLNLSARAGFREYDTFLRVWNVLHLTHEQQIEEVMDSTSAGYILKYQIYHIFGGNNHADMAIQPTWDLRRGYIGSAYSGGNFGRMTFYRPVDENGDSLDVAKRGLTLTVNSPDIHIENIYGGGRIGNIEPAIEGPAPEGFFGATLNVHRGVIDHVYGGNDVAGEVMHGTSVNITGAISGDVYCAGNGNYLYQYDPLLYDEDNPNATHIIERYDTRLGGRYFVLPRRAGYGDDKPTQEQVLLAINSYRPNIDKASLYIAGTSPDSVACVFGNVYCGGNSSTIAPIREGDNTRPGDIRFSIGDNVILNGVYLGSNGEGLTNNDMIFLTELANGIDLTKSNILGPHHLAQMKADSTGFAMRDSVALDLDLYPHLLDLYMRAVDVDAVPRDFMLSQTLKNAYIGDFFVGGNNGSMLTREPISLTFPENLVIFNKLVGGCNSATVNYKTVSHIGGVTAPMDTANVVTDWEFTPDGSSVKVTRPAPKVHLAVKSRFQPWKILYPADGDIHNLRLGLNYAETADGQIIFPRNVCSIFGGCYNSGHVNGNIEIDLFTDLIADYDPSKPEEKAIADTLSAHGLTDKRRAILTAATDSTWAAFSVIGGGYGANTRVNGDIRIRMLPGKASPTYVADRAQDVVPTDPHPSVGTLFGGSMAGTVVGNTTLEVRDGTVLSNMYAASEAAPMYGSTQILIGWPQYYVCTRKGNYMMLRTDSISKPMQALASGDADDITEWTNYDLRQTYAVRRWISTRKGDIISAELYKLLPDTAKTAFALVTDVPSRFSETNGDGHASTPFNWNDIDIHIGDSRSRANTPGMANPAPYYGQGNIYGGGFINSRSDVSLAGQLTVRRFDADHTPGSAFVNTEDGKIEGDASLLSFGGNSTILVADNHLNADRAVLVGSAHPATGEILRDHITIGTAHHVPVTMAPGLDIAGKYIYEDNPANVGYGHFMCQSPHVLGTDAHGDPDPSDPYLSKTYYEVESDGGFYGGGRNVFVEGFRTLDLGYYGYAETSPEYPKLVNTLQRFDLLRVLDCCMQLQGATDYANKSLDTSPYSITRIGELVMESSLPVDEAFECGERGSAMRLYNMMHSTPRSRNYLGFYSDAQYVASITSSVSMDDPYHGADGELMHTGDFATSGLVADSDPTDDGTEPFSYALYKQRRIDNYYAARSLPYDSINAQGDSVYTYARQQVVARALAAFDKRNLGTSANMIGMNNGYQLYVQGSVIKKDGSERVFFGPITGVVEFKLLSLSENEGGGYVYALNMHDDANNFMQSTGNCIFPGAAYMGGKENDEEKYNYIYDDCFPMGQGWEKYFGWTAGSQSSPTIKKPSQAPAVPGRISGLRSSTAPAAGHGDCNEEQEIHYWYVNGNNYTYNVTLTACTYNNPSSFTLSHTDNMIYLFGMAPSSEFKLKSVTWSPSDNDEPELVYSADMSPDLLDRAKDLHYSLYFSVDSVPQEAHSLTDIADRYPNSYVTAIPRANYEAGSTIDPAYTALGSGSAWNHYSDPASGTNMPLLGITLVDSVDNSGRQYYDPHLSKPEHGRIVLEGKDGDNTFTYTINLDINYILGPVINGYLAIENDALPGEYIYANSFNVSVDLDETNLAITDRNWYLIAPDVDIFDDEGNPDHNVLLNVLHNPENYPVESLNDQKIGGRDRQIHIPAYLYRDGWNLVYEIKANDQSFFRMADTTKLNNPQKPYHNCVEVHNYHRMRPYDGTSLNFATDDEGEYVYDGDGNLVTSPKYEDLRLTAGARIYIEDQADFDYFFEWLDSLQREAVEHPATADQRLLRTTPLNGSIDPRYADSLCVFLMTDVKMPEMPTDKLRNLRFNGIFHGGGHNIDMGDAPLFLGHNSGFFYNTGFVSSRQGASNAVVFDDNSSGHIENCFLYNSKDVSNGYLVSPGNLYSGTIINCYRTADTDSKEYYATADPVIVGLVVANHDDFEFGAVAYNLNRFYLNHRYTQHATDTDADTERTLGIIHWLFSDGSYRYARYSERGAPTALRTREVPNYHDFRGLRSSVTYELYDGSITGADATMHNTMDTPDLARLAVDADSVPVLDAMGRYTYHPLTADYMFFGQTLTSHDEETSHPEALRYDRSNRVYRASGFYGSHRDEGYHFNVEAHAVNPRLTAIDFTGLNVARHGVAYRKGLVDFGDGSEICYYTPILDLPDTAAVNKYLGYQADFEGPAILRVSSREHPDGHEPVTRNLIVICNDTIPGGAPNPAFADLRYDTRTEEYNIYAHLMHPKAWRADGLPEFRDGEANVEVELVHLVDGEDYNAPYAYDVTRSIWYERRPRNFSMQGDAWEGIVLPFSPTETRAMTEGVNTPGHTEASVPSHGLLTHFYGPAPGKDQEAISHEYWLRKFTGHAMEQGKHKLYFDRPASEADKSSGNPADALYASITGNELHYSNTYFTDAYGADYLHTESSSTKPYTPEGVEHTDYPLLTMCQPYIVSFPGQRYYEFDLSGKFYNEVYPLVPATAQYVVFACNTPTTVPVTDDAPPATITHDGYKFTGTFMHAEPTSRTAVIVSSDEDRTVDDDFQRAQAGVKVEPFRTYMVMPGPEPAPMRISQHSIPDPAQEIVEPEQEEPEDELAELEIWVEDDVLVIMSPFEEAFDLPLFDMQGRILQMLHVEDGDNRYPGLSPGFYMTARTKFRIK